MIPREPTPTALPATPEGASLGEPRVAPLSSGWTAGRIAAIAAGVLLALVSLGLLVGAGLGVWADLTQRDDGYVTTGTRSFSSTGAALETERTKLGAPGVGWLYAPGVLDKIRVRITPTRPGQRLFVGIGPADDVERYLAGVKHTRIVDFWGRGVETVDGDNAAPPPGAQAFWVASTSGSGPRTLVWKPTGGSWSVVVMNADGPRAIAVSADLGARLPALLWIALVSLLLAAVCLAGGALLVIGAIRRRRASRLDTYAKRGGTNHAAD